MLAGAALWLFCSSISLVGSLIMFDCDLITVQIYRTLKGLVNCMKCANWFCATGASYFTYISKYGILRPLTNMFRSTVL
jgi:hypothetical protein